MSGITSLRNRRVALLIVVAVLFAWRLTAVAEEGRHRSEASGVLALPVVEIPVLNGSVSDTTTAIVYFYAEACPYCGMDHVMVQRAAHSLKEAGVEFKAIHIGSAMYAGSYWSADSGAVPDAVVEMSLGEAASLGVSGVPVLALVKRGRVKRAWQGKLTWTHAPLVSAVRCELGNRWSCAQLWTWSLANGLRKRTTGLVSRFT